MAVQDGYAFPPPNSIESGPNIFTGDDYDAVVPLSHYNPNTGGLTLHGTADTTFRYRMRAFDTTLAVYVYWNSLNIDVGGTGYAGPGPLTNVVVSNILPL